MNIHIVYIIIRCYNLCKIKIMCKLLCKILSRTWSRMCHHVSNHLKHKISCGHDLPALNCPQDIKIRINTVDCILLQNVLSCSQLEIVQLQNKTVFIGPTLIAFGILSGILLILQWEDFNILPFKNTRRVIFLTCKLTWLLTKIYQS